MAAALTVLMLLSGLSLIAFGSLRYRDYPPMPIRVACVGDSITEGSGYPDDLQKILGNRYLVGNFGVSGSAVSLNSNTPYMNQTAYQRAQMYNPEIIIIMLGTNDAKQSNQSNNDNFTVIYERMISEFQSLRSTPDVWLVEPPPIFNNTLDLSEANLVKSVIPGIRQVANDLSLQTISVHLALGDPEWFCDGVHPSSEGAQLLAEQISQAITSDVN